MDDRPPEEGDGKRSRRDILNSFKKGAIIGGFIGLALGTKARRDYDQSNEDSPHPQNLTTSTVPQFNRPALSDLGEAAPVETAGIQAINAQHESLNPEKSPPLPKYTEIFFSNYSAEQKEALISRGRSIVKERKSDWKGLTREEIDSFIKGTISKEELEKRVESSLSQFDTKYPKPLMQKVVMAIIETESRRRPDEESHSGAIGLMQIMKTTAIEAANRLRLKDFKWDIALVKQVDLNLKLGIQALIIKMEAVSHLDEAIEAYHSGQTAVNDLKEIYSRTSPTRPNNQANIFTMISNTNAVQAYASEHDGYNPFATEYLATVVGSWADLYPEDFSKDVLKIVSGG